MRELHLFAGAGGGILGGILLGHTCVCAVELIAYRRKVLLQRQRDRILPKFPIWDDIRTFNGTPWRGRVDAVCGGFPCKGISIQGNRNGLEHEESALWGEQARIISEIRPGNVFIENSPRLTLQGGGRVISDLASMGYDCWWGIISAADAIWTFGIPRFDHLRERIWIYGKASHSNTTRLLHISQVQAGGEQPWRDFVGRSRVAAKGYGSWWGTEPELGRMVNGMANRLDRLRAIGDGQVPAVAKVAWETLNSFTD